MKAEEALKKVTHSLLLGTFLLLMQLQISVANDLMKASNAWVRELPPTAKNSAVYLDLQNISDTDDQVIGVSTEFATSAELHRTVIKSIKEDAPSESKDSAQKEEKPAAPVRKATEVMLMQKVALLHVPAKGKLSLIPGGAHIMLVGLKAPLKEGDVIPLTLSFQNAGELRIDVPVKKIEGGASFQSKPQEHDHHH